MGRILAIDYGQKRAGLAVTDEMQMIASPLATIHVSEIMAYLEAYIAREPVEIIVVGEPKDMDNRPSDAARFTEPFVKKLKRFFPGIPVERYDERFTSRMAFQTLIDSGISKKARSDKSKLDRISASLILQSWLEARDNKQIT
jgi:putative Holliday junction resolvase